MNETDITPEVVAQHGLSSAEYDKIKELMGREPNISQNWMESKIPKSSPTRLRSSSQIESKQSVRIP